MPALSSYLNVYNSALVILRDKGFKVWTTQDEGTWYAERNGWDFMADDPIALLGLIAIFEYHNPQTHSEYWWKIDSPCLVDSIPTIAPFYKPVSGSLPPGN